ncbi:selenoprotein S [Anoplophora glabripennis]|uniref:Selenoprotein S n=1 Tax=Anoplophora glabripennis TaxID=217634 RepID=V5GQI6_ANOGL|nr:selenoprotein S [Anoplophora glabripennis]
MDILEKPVLLLANYGWYILGVGVVLAYFYQKALRFHIDAYKKRKGEEEYAAKYHKNPDLFVARQVAQQEYAMKLQEKYRLDAEEHERKMKEKERKKQEEILQKYEGQGGQKSGYKDDGVNSSRPEYNPLMGAGSSSSYRAPKRSACSRGGCG